MFCREQVAQLRDINPQIEEKGARLAVIGNGSPTQAKAFKEDRQLDFPLLTDPGLGAFKAAGFKRGVGATFTPRFAKNMLRAMSAGHRQSWVEGDPWQQGGAMVIRPGDELLFLQISQAAGDHADPRDLLEILS